MSLSCDCNSEWDGEGICWFDPSDFSTYEPKRGKRCNSCKKVIIKTGNLGLEFSRMRPPENDIEERIYGDEIPLASKWMCEDCGEIFLNLTAIGYCLEIFDDMRNDLKEYWKLTGFEPKPKKDTNETQKQN